MTPAQQIDTLIKLMTEIVYTFINGKSASWVRRRDIAHELEFYRVSVPQNSTHDVKEYANMLAPCLRALEDDDRVHYRKEGNKVWYKCKTG